MAKKQKISITIGADGGIEMHAEGFAGPTCTSEIDKLLVGLRVIERKRTADHYRQDRRVAVHRSKA